MYQSAAVGQRDVIAVEDEAADADIVAARRRSNDGPAVMTSRVEPMTPAIAA